MANPQVRPSPAGDAAVVVRPPVAAIGVVGWLRKNLFSSWLNSILTLVSLWLVYKVVGGAVNWATTEAKWIVVTANLKLYMVGQYPNEQLWRIWVVLMLVGFLAGVSWAAWGRWRLQIAAAVMLAGLLLALGPIDLSSRIWFLLCAASVPVGFLVGHKVPGFAQRTWMMWLTATPVILIMIRGVGFVPGLPVQSTNIWGGLLLTVLLAVLGILLSFPFGVLLALGRRSSLPAIRIASVIYIEVVRGVPLVSLLFIGAYILPVFLPSGIRVDAVIRALVAITMFSAAYLAENVRGGLQAISKGQTEAAHALGLSGWQTITFIVLPQALRAVIPAIVGQFIGLFKDTSLVVIVSLLDLMGIGRAIISNPDPNFLGKHFEVYTFFAAIYFVFCATLSYASRRLERSLGVGER